MKRWRKLGIIALLSAGAGLTASAYIHRQDPMLLHLFADSSCACSDYDEEVSGLTVFNPFRDRSPEASADKFLGESRQGRCPVMASSINPSVCEFFMDHRRASEWKLVSRRDQPQQVSLYYKLTKLGVEPKYRFTGVGFIEVVELKAGWRVNGFDAQF